MKSMSHSSRHSGARLLAVDPSLRSTGWALFEVSAGGLISCGVLSPPRVSDLLASRLAALQLQVEHLFSHLELTVADILVCEGPAPLVLNPQSAIKVEHVRGIFEVIARSKGMVVPGRINPRTVQSEVLGMRGKQLARKKVKSWAREVAQQLYGNNLPIVTNSDGRVAQLVSQDIVDALLVGSLALSRIQLASRSQLDLAAAFASSFRSSTGRTRRGFGRGWERVVRDAG